MFKAIKQFLQEALRELGRVTWPSRTAVLRMTVGVAVISVLFGVFAGLVDLGITTALRQALVLGGPVNSGQQSTPIQVDPGDIQVDTGAAQ